MRLKPEHINHIIEKYSHARTHLTDYTKDVKHDIAEALFPQLTEEQLQEKIKFMPWNPTYIQELCARAKDIIDVFTQNPWLEDMYEEMLDIRLDSLASQKAEQQWAIDKKLIKRIK